MVTATSDVWGSSRFLQIYRISHKETKESGGHWPLCRGPGGSSWAMSEPAGGTSSNNQSDLCYIIIIPPHRKRPTQQSWYILVALNVKCSFKGWKSCSIKNPNCKPLWLLLIWQRGSWDNQSYSCYIIITQTHRKRQSIVTKPPETMAEERLPTNDGGAHIFFKNYSNYAFHISFDIVWELLKDILGCFISFFPENLIWDARKTFNVLIQDLS